MSLSIVDILFLITVVLLILSGLRNGAVLTLVSLLAIPLGAYIAYAYGPHLMDILAANGLSATPLIAYAVLFLGTVIVVKIIGGIVRGVVKSLPLISQADTLIGGALGIVEAWLIWVVLLFILGSFLGNVQAGIQQGSTVVPGLTITVSQYQVWHDFYNQAVTNSLFAHVNGFFIHNLPAVKE